MTTYPPLDLGSAYYGSLAGCGGVQLVDQVNNPANANPVKLIFPPWVEKIGPISRDFYSANYTLALPGNGTVALPAITLPSGQVGWLQQFTAFLLTPTAASRVTYTVRINQGPVSGFDQYQMLPGVAQFISLDNDDLRIAVPEGATIDVLITNGTATAETVGAKIAGWYHPLQAELAYWGPCR